jgi:hypothetical protein
MDKQVDHVPLFSTWALWFKWRKGKIAVQPRRLADQAFANGLREHEPLGQAKSAKTGAA